jgi:hypothetical protein
MGMTVKIDTNNPELLKTPEFQPLEPGKYRFEVANDLKVENAKTGKQSPMIAVELRCVDEEHKGKKVNDNIVLTQDTQWKFAQFCKACGIESDANGEVDLSQFRGCVLEAEVSTEPFTYQKGAKIGQKGLSNRVARYLFEGMDAQTTTT